MRRDKELRYVLVAITGNKSLLEDPREHRGPGPAKEELESPLDRSAMEFSNRLSGFGV